MKRTERMEQLVQIDRDIEEAKVWRRRLTRKIRWLKDKKREVLAELGGGAETSTRKSPRRGSEGERQGDSVSDRSVMREEPEVKPEAERRREEIDRRLIEALDAALDKADALRILMEHGWRLACEKKGGVE